MVTKKRTREVIYSKFLLLIGGKCEAEGGAGPSDGHTAEVAEVKLEPRSLDSVESSFEYRIPAAHHEDLILLKSRKLKLGSQTRVSPDLLGPIHSYPTCWCSLWLQGLKPKNVVQMDPFLLFRRPFQQKVGSQLRETCRPSYGRKQTAAWGCF